MSPRIAIDRARRIFLCLLFVMLPPAASAQAGWPSRPITIIVPYAAGSLPDVFARAVANELGTRLNSTVIVDNVNGAGGVLGTERVARAKPDGYTFVLGVESTMLIAQMVRPATVRYDGLKDFTPVALMASSPLVLVAKPEFPAHTLSDLLALLRVQPRSFSYGTSGVGTSLHLAGEMFNQQARAEIAHVPYSVSTQIMTDVAGNQLDLAMVPLGSALPFIRSAKVKALGVTAPARSNLLPDVSAMNELPALGNMNFTVWFGLFAPAGVDKSIGTSVHAHLAAIFGMESIRQRIADFGMQPTVLDQAAFTRFLAAERAKFKSLISERSIRAE